VSLLNLSLTRGWFPPVTLSLGLLAVALLVAGRPFTATGRRQWWTRRVPLGILAGALAGGAVILIVDVLWRPFPDPLPRGVAVWTGLSAGGFALAVLRPGRALGKALALLAVVVVVLASAVPVRPRPPVQATSTRSSVARFHASRKAASASSRLMGSRQSGQRIHRDGQPTGGGVLPCRYSANWGTASSGTGWRRPRPRSSRPDGRRRTPDADRSQVPSSPITSP